MSCPCKKGLTRQDIIVLAGIAALIALFTLSSTPGQWFATGTRNHPLFMGFLKFAVLATFGEALALRLNAGVFNRPGFGLMPKAVVWGIIGVVITIMFMVFGTGVPAALIQLDVLPSADVLRGPLTLQKVLASFSISVLLNLTFAPLFMVAHKLTDLHIAAHNGALSSLWTAMHPGKLLAQVDWNVMWGFVILKTIPLFWVPMHTITFLLPPEFRVLFAAALGIALGVILAFAIMKKA